MKIKKGTHAAIFSRKSSPSSEQMHADNKSQSTLKLQDSKESTQQNSKQPENTSPVIIKQDNNTVTQVPAIEVSKELLRIRGTWPFDFAPDELIIEEKRIIIKRNNFPVGGSVMSLPFQKLVSFEVNHAFFYSAIYIKGEGEALNYIMQWLKPKDAIRAKEIVDGLRLKQSESIEIKEKDPHKISQTLQTLGRT